MSDRSTERMPSLPFLWWAIGLALVGGFGLGTALFLAPAFGLPIGPWWPAAVRAHGHVQLYGWGGMFALGVGLYFLPRLRGCPPPSPRLVRNAAALLRVVPLFSPSSPLTLGLLGLAGALGVAAVGCLGWTLWRTVRG